MRSLFRAFSGVFRYKAALCASVTCVLFLGVLYSVGIGTMLPVIKTLISDDGLHGWVRGMRAESRLGASLRREEGPTGGLRVARVDAGSPLADDALFTDGGVRITAIDGVPVVGADRPDAAVVRLLERGPGESVELTAARDVGGAPVSVRVVPRPEPSLLKAAGAIADRLPEGGPAEQLQTLTWVLGFFVAVAGAGAALQYVQDYLTWRICNRTVADLRCRAFDALVRRSVGDVQRAGVHELQGRFVTEYDELRGAFVLMLGQTLREPIKAAAALVLAFYVNWIMAVACLVLVPPALLIIRLVNRRLQQKSWRIMASAGRIQAVIQETLAGIRVVKAYTAENRERRRFLAVNREQLEAAAAAARSVSAAGPLTEFLTSAGAAGLAIFAAYLVMHGSLARDSFFAFLLCVVALADPIRKSTPVWSIFKRADAAASRVFDLINAPPEGTDADGRSPVGADVAPLSRELTFEGVGFSYSAGGPQVLADVSLTVPAGTTFALVGPNGSGKTTLVSLIPRLFQPTRGRLLWDGRDLRELDLMRLRRRIAVVTQEAVIFKDTVHNNIAYGEEDCPRERVIEAARRARCHDFIVGLRDAAGAAGYDAELAEQGQSLSGGQRQRITLARAILRDPSVLILDEATSQIDSESEALIREAIAEFGRGRTVIVIAHRLSTVRHADRIAVLEDGRLAAVGAHAELLGGCDLYRRLCEHQLVEVPAAG